MIKVQVVAITDPASTATVQSVVSQCAVNRGNFVILMIFWLVWCYCVFPPSVLPKKLFWFAKDSISDILLCRSWTTYLRRIHVPESYD